MGIPLITLMILYIIPLTRKLDPYTGIPQEYSLNELKLPPCFVLASEKDRIGLGAILSGKECKSITFSPDNPLT